MSDKTVINDDNLIKVKVIKSFFYAAHQIFIEDPTSLMRGKDEKINRLAVRLIKEMEFLSLEGIKAASDYEGIKFRLGMLNNLDNTVKVKS